MGRIADIFAAARRENRGLVMPFITGGDPSVPGTVALLAAMERAGAVAVEIGIPFSDPIADGPVIAASMHEALVRGVTPRAIFDALRETRRPAPGAAGGMATGGSGSSGVGAVAMVSVSIVHRIGADRFIGDVADAGLDGVIVPDADLGVAGELSTLCDRRGMSCSFLVAPTSSPERVRQIVGLCRGFVYLLARAGVTGESGGPPDLRRQADAIRAADATIPIAAGFGIATPEHVRATVAQVDGAIVGSALVRRMADAVKRGADPVADAEAFVRLLVDAARR